MNNSILSLNNVRKEFQIRGRGLLGTKQTLVAVDDVTFDVQRGETLAMVGESGCGKTTTARLALGLLPTTSGEIVFDGEQLSSKRLRDDRALRRNLQVVFQDPSSALNPRKQLHRILSDTLLLHSVVPRSEVRQRSADLLERVGLTPGTAFLSRWPHQLSGGQKQRVGIARAIALDPKLIVADEPVSALDVSVRARILGLLRELQVDLGLSYLLISHDLAAVRSIADRVAVMYLGQIVEMGSAQEIFEMPLHPYTVGLLLSTPRPDPRSRWEGAPVVGEAPSPLNPPSGCRFRTRCPIAEAICATEPPPLEEKAGFGSRVVACHFPERAQDLWRAKAMRAPQEKEGGSPTGVPARRVP